MAIRETFILESEADLRGLDRAIDAMDDVDDKLRDLEGAGEAAERGANKAGRAFGGLVDNIKNAGKVILASGAILAGLSAGVVTAGLAEWNRFERGMNEVFTLMPDMSEAAMGEMRENVRALATEAGVLPNEIVPALYQAISAGVPPDNIFAFMRTATEASIGGATDLETAVNGITNAVNAYGADVLSATQASDLMFTGVRLGKTTFGELSDSMFQVLPTAAALELGLDQVLASVTVLTAQGVPTSVAMTQMRQALVELQDSSTGVGQVFQRVAGKDFKDFIANGGDLGQAMALLSGYAEDAGVDLNQLFGSVEAGNFALALTGEGAERFAANLGEMQNSAGATHAAFEQMNRGIGRSLDRMKAKLAVTLGRIGEIFAPFVTLVVDSFSAILDLFSLGLIGADATDFLESLPGFLEPIGRAALGVGRFVGQLAEHFRLFFRQLERGLPLALALRALLVRLGVPKEFIDALGDIAEGIRNLFTPIMDWIRNNVELQDVLVALGIALAAIIIPALIGMGTALAGILIPLGLLVGAVALIRRAWETDFLGIRSFIEEKISPFLSGLWDAIREGGIGGGLNFIKENLIDPLVSQITEYIGSGQLWDDAVRLGGSILEAIGTGIVVAATWISEHILQPIVDNAGTAIAGIDWGQVASDLLSAIGSALTMLGNWATWLGENVLSPILNNAATAIAGIDWSEVGAGIVNAIGDALKLGFDFIAWIIDSIFNPMSDNAEGAAGGIDWGGVASAILNAIGSVLKAGFDFISWVSENILAPLILGAVSAIAEKDWSELPRELFNAIANALPNIRDWLIEHIINPMMEFFAPENLTELLNKAGEIATAILAGILGVLGDMAAWAHEHIVQPILDAISDALAAIANFFASDDYGTWRDTMEQTQGFMGASGVENLPTTDTGNNLPLPFNPLGDQAGTPWTGFGPLDEVAGFHHRQEAVVPAGGMRVFPSPAGLMLEGGGADNGRMVDLLTEIRDLLAADDNPRVEANIYTNASSMERLLTTLDAARRTT